MLFIQYIPNWLPLLWLYINCSPGHQEPPACRCNGHSVFISLVLMVAASVFLLFFSSYFSVSFSSSFSTQNQNTGALQSSDLDSLLTTHTPIHPITLSATYKDKTLVFITPVFFLHSKCKFIIPCLSSTWNSRECHNKIFKMKILIFTPWSALPISSLVQCDTLSCLRQKQRFYLALCDTSLSYPPSNS